MDFEKQVAKQQEINKAVHESMKNSNAIHKQFFNAIQSLEQRIAQLEAALESRETQEMEQGERDES